MSDNSGRGLYNNYLMFLFLLSDFFLGFLSKFVFYLYLLIVILFCFYRKFQVKNLVSEAEFTICKYPKHSQYKVRLIIGMAF